jgi:hypothetical protein
MREIPVIIEHGEESVQTKARIKRRKDKVLGPYFVESDDLFAIEQIISEKFGFLISLKRLRQLMEHSFETREGEPIRIRI